MIPTNRHLWAVPTGGDIGIETEEEREIVPLPATEPVHEPAAPTIVPDREPVPA